MRKPTYENIEESLKVALNDLNILAGDIVGPSDSSWQDVAGTAAVNLRELARLLDAARLERGQFQSFPSPSEVLDCILHGEPDEQNEVTPEQELFGL